MISTRIAVFMRLNGWVLNLGFLALGSYFLASAANAVVARKIRLIPTVDDASPVSLLPQSLAFSQKPQFAVMAERNLLGLKREALSSAESAQNAAPNQVSGRNFKESELQPCTLNAIVRATLVADNPEWSMAVLLNNATHEPAVFTINDGSNMIADDAVLVAVRSREVVVRRRDHFERCQGEGEMASVQPPPVVAEPIYGGDPADPNPNDMTGVTKLSETDYRVERTEVDRVLANLNEVAMQARIVPSFKNGKANGFKMFSIKQGSIYSKIGLQNGDVIQKINGFEMNSPDRALEVYSKLRDATSLVIEIQRRGESRTLNYAIH
jgi:general secretion pathway protein C